jgi:hypothetical protein
MNEPNQSDRYKLLLVAMMSYKDNVVYSNDYEFTQEQLGAIVPGDICKWMATKVYGRPDPGPNDNPTFGRSTSLAYYKKAISYFMPNKLEPWNVLANCGNPTRSVCINDLIKAVKKKEVRKQGKATMSRRALEASEFVQTIQMLRSFQDVLHRFHLPALCITQFALIGRIDDCVELQKANLKVNLRFPFTLLCQMCWSKNVSDERQAPDQILMGAMSPTYCVLLALAMHLETWLQSGL